MDNVQTETAAEKHVFRSALTNARPRQRLTTRSNHLSGRHRCMACRIGAIGAGMPVECPDYRHKCDPGLMGHSAGFRVVVAADVD